MHYFRFLGLLSMLFVFSGVAAPALAASGPTLREVRLSGQDSRAQVEIIADSPLTYTCYRMPDLLKVAVDLALVDPGQVNPLIPGAGPVSKITVAKKDITTFSLTRLLIDLNSDADFTVHPDAADRSRLLVTFSPKSATVREKQEDLLERDGKAPEAPSPSVTESPIAAPLAAAVVPPTATSAAPVTEDSPTVVEETPKVPAQKRLIEPVVPDKPRWRIINEITINKNAVVINATSRLDDYKAFTLIKPARLVIDVPMSSTHLAAKEIFLNRFGISKARIGNYPDKVRMVFDAEGTTFPPYRIDQNNKGLAIVFAPGTSK